MRWWGKLFLVVVVCFSLKGFSQEDVTFKYKKVAVTSDTITIASKSINTAFFKITKADQSPINPDQYWVDYTKSRLVLKPGNEITTDSIVIRYLDFPEFLTQKYSLYDQKKILNSPINLADLRKDTRPKSALYEPFEGLNTSGSISRGITIGNNQNAVVNSNLDLQLSGQIAEGVTLRASIQDSNIPIQDGGYSQKLDQFDQVFMELFGDKWNIRGGDLFLENRKLSFLNFNKKVQGISTHFQLGKEGNITTIDNSVGIVRGQYAKSVFVGQEGNQGPYKLKGSGNELYVLVISGSERVFVNGIALTRGETGDYVIDYGAGEVTFNATYPITSEMRITVEYQFSDRNYNRFITYNDIKHQRDRWYVGGYLYAEGDIKNQPLQQSLTDEQKLVLSQAGDNKDKMVAPSAIVANYEVDKILYHKRIIDNQEVYVLANNPNELVYKVQFSQVGQNLGNYNVINRFDVNKTYQYVSPVNGIKQGTHEPFVSIVAPINLQVYVFEGGYKNEDKTTITTELSVSKKDSNLFSGIDDQDNQGVAGKIITKQRLLSKKWQGDVFANYQLIQQSFSPVERVLEVEFNRDWNLNNPTGTQRMLSSGLDFKLPKKGAILYSYNNLQYAKDFEGNKHLVNSFFTLKKWRLTHQSSWMKSQSTYAQAEFLRTQTQARYHFYKNWIGGSQRIEDNQEIVNNTRQFSAKSQRFSEWGAHVGRGDSTKVYIQIGYLERKNDSLRKIQLQRVNTSQSYYLKSKMIQNDNHDLTLFVNYRNLVYADKLKADVPTLNSRLNYSGSYFQRMVQTNLLYENTSGSLAQQDFTYIEVEAGKGIYTWIDYNNNKIQELSEFEVAQFKDQAKFVRLFLPNQIFVKTYQNKFSGSVSLNPSAWHIKEGWYKTASHFYNQSSYLVERKTAQNGAHFEWNPFDNSSLDVLGLTTLVRNSLYYNRGLQKNSIVYNFITSATQNLLATGKQNSQNKSHQIQYNHLVQQTWLFSVETKYAEIDNTSENFSARNYQLVQYQIQPKLGYLFDKDSNVNVFYNYHQKNNQITEFESLKQQQIGLEFNYISSKWATIKTLFSYFKNDYLGNANTAVAYQMLEGLLPGKNYTWQIFLQKSITQYLDVNLNYQGRKGGTSKTIHTGSMQLRASF